MIHFLQTTPNNQVLYGCFTWMIQDSNMGNGWESPFPSIKNGLALGFQVKNVQRFQVPKDSGIPNLKVLYVPYVGLF